VVPRDRTRGNRHKLKQYEVPFEHEEELLHLEDDRVLEQAPQRRCGVSFSREIQTCLDAVLCSLL